MIVPLERRERPPVGRALSLQRGDWRPPCRENDSMPLGQNRIDRIPAESRTTRMLDGELPATARPAR